MSDAPFVLAWLLLAHLLADFVFQTERIATTKFGHGRAAWNALLAHAAVVGAGCLPLVPIFGFPGLGYALVAAGSHLVIDRLKIVLLLRDEPSHETSPPPSVDEPRTEPSAEEGDGLFGGPPLDRSWTPRPAALFILDQLAHAFVLVAAWALLLSTAAPTDLWLSWIEPLVRTTDREAFHRVVLGIVVLADLVIVDVRAAALLVSTLVRAPRPRPDAAGSGAASPARVGATIGVLERLIVSTLVLAGAFNAIGLVVAAKTVARFRQLDNREFAEYYLLGTLASVSVAIIAALGAQVLLR